MRKRRGRGETTLAAGRKGERDLAYTELKTNISLKYYKRVHGAFIQTKINYLCYLKTLNLSLVP